MKVAPLLHPQPRLSRRELLDLTNELLLLGPYYRLSPNLDEKRVAEELAPFDQDWKIYNPSKPEYKRSGLSITSLDGGLSGMPDLTSLLEYNREHGTTYREASFTTLTPVYEACKTLHEFMDPFLPFLCRTHFLRFEKGGFFPYHRDNSGPGEVFRIFIPLHVHSTQDFVFLLGPQRIELEKGHPYFINTLMEHALFTFDGPSTHLVMNVRLCAESVDLVRSKLAFY